MSIPLDEVISGDLHFLLYAFFFFFLTLQFPHEENALTWRTEAG